MLDQNEKEKDHVDKESHGSSTLDMDKDKEISKLKDIITKKDKEIISLQNALAKSQEFIVNVHQSPPLKLFRDYDSSIGKMFPIRIKKVFKTSKGKLVTKRSSIIKNLREQRPTKKDIICFPMINWNYRQQRPQHILSQFADEGHRVFYLSTILEKLQNPYEIDIISDNVYEIALSSPKFIDIYKDKIDETLLKSLNGIFHRLKDELNLDAVSFTLFPFWSPLVSELRKSLGWKIILDCPDNIQGFPNISKDRTKEEKTLLQTSDLVITSANSLYNNINKKTKKVILAPNACDFHHFNELRNDTLLEGFQKPIAGYFGAIAEWFDTELIEFLANARPDVTFIFIGDTYGANLKGLLNLENVYFLGERPYSEIPKYLHSFDICLIPFKLTPLILDTHPIKIYEYFAAGKPVVTTKIPEILPMKDLCYVANGKKDFLEKMNKALQENDQEIIQKRINFSSMNTWHNRYETIIYELNKIPLLGLETHS